MGFNIIAPYNMEFLHLNWYIAEWEHMWGQWDISSLGRDLKCLFTTKMVDANYNQLPLSTVRTETRKYGITKSGPEAGSQSQLLMSRDQYAGPPIDHKWVHKVQDILPKKDVWNSHPTFVRTETLKYGITKSGPEAGSQSQLHSPNRSTIQLGIPIWIRIQLWIST